MENKIRLTKPLLINGKEVTELTYDAAEITVQQFLEAEFYKFSISGNKPTVTAKEFDTGLHLYLGMVAIIAKNPHIDLKDLERVKGADIIQIGNIGRNFIGAGNAADSGLDISGDTSAITPGPTTAAPENSDVIDC